MAVIFLWSLIWTYGKRSWLLPTIALLAAILIVPIYFAEINETIYNVFHKEVGAIRGDVAVERTFAGRWILWEQMIGDWQQYDLSRQLFGTGEITLYSHNDYLQMLFHGGIVGLILYVSFLVVVGWRLSTYFFKTKSTISILALMAYSMWIIDTIGLVPSVYTGYQWFVWGVIGLCLRMHKEAIRTGNYRLIRE